MLRLTALLTGVALLLTGSGLLGTLLAVSGGEAGFGAGTLGLVMSGYFAGFFMGTFFAPSLIGRIGHIRAFAFFAALAAIIVTPAALMLLGDRLDSLDVRRALRVAYQYKPKLTRHERYKILMKTGEIMRGL